MGNRRRSQEHFLFYSEDLSGCQVVLDEAEARHAHRAVRLASGDRISVMDGRGNIALCRIESIGKNGVTCRVIQRDTRLPSGPAMHFFVGLPDRQALEEVLAGVVPFGAASVVPVVSRRCERPWWRSWERHRDRLHRKMIAVAKQCWCARLPELTAPTAMADAVAACGGSVLRADPAGSRLAELRGRIRATEEFSCFVGPPGGFTGEEVDLLTERGALAVCLSPYRLRTEAAAAAMAAVVVQVFGAEHGAPGPDSPP